ncbi:MAG: ABC transporter substrate-binding protein, partial [Spirochaetota bacterium]
MRRFVIGIAAAVLSLPLVFGQGAKTDLTWLYWYPEPKELIAAYQKLNPNVTITYEQVGGNNFAKVLNTRIMADELPDMYVPYYIETYDQQVKADALVDLSSESFVKTLDANAVGLNSRNGKLYAFPLESTVICTFYNKELFKKYNVKVPTNYAEFLKASETFKKNGVVPLVQGMADLWQGKYAGGFNQLSAVLYNDGDWLTKLNNRQVKWTDAAMLKQYQKKESYFKAGYQHADSLGMNFDQAWKVFCTGGA